MYTVTKHIVFNNEKKKFTVANERHVKYIQCSVKI